MATQRTDEPTPFAVPFGSWRVDPAHSEVGFMVKTLWGLVPVKGRFERFDGTLHIRPTTDPSGELIIQSASLNTRNTRRDKHLRSEDFFNVEQYPQISFTVTAITSRADGLTVAGDLQIATHSIPLELPVVVQHAEGGRLRLRTTTRVAREAAGMTWNLVGMISDEAHLHLELELAPDA